MEQRAADPNTVPVLDEQFLLVETSGAGVAVHLAAEGADAGVRSAVPAAWFRSDRSGYVATIANYDRRALESAHWSTRTLCGRPWMAMAAGDGGRSTVTNRRSTRRPAVDASPSWTADSHRRTPTAGSE